MGNNKASGIKKNLFFSIFSQFTIMALGIIIPRLVIVSFGSEVNGLLSTVTQIFTYVALLEAGIGNASVNSLYKPIANSDKHQISDVLSATKKYYRKITRIYFLCVIVLAAVYPLIVKGDLSYQTVALVILFQGLSGVLNFYFVAAYKQLLIADGKNYIIQNITLIVYVLSSISKIILILYGFDIVLLQFIYFLIHCGQVAIYVSIIKKKYKWLVDHKNPDMDALSQRNAFLIHEISGTVFSSTDTFVLSTFCSLKVASVYSVYNMVFIALNSMINSINSGLVYILGQTYAKDKTRYEKTHDVYDSLYMALVFSLMSVAFIMIIPFVNLYTKDVTDIEYVDFKLPILFAVIQLMSCSRAVSARLITIAGHAKATQWRSLAEAIINLVSSLVLVHWIGIYGVLLGTVIALTYRINDIIIYANKHILKRSPFKTYKKILLNVSLFCVFIVAALILNNFLIASCKSYFHFAIWGLAFTIFSFVIYGVAALLSSRDLRIILRHRLSTRK